MPDFNFKRLAARKPLTRLDAHTSAAQWSSGAFRLFQRKFSCRRFPLVGLFQFRIVSRRPAPHAAGIAGAEAGIRYCDKAGKRLVDLLVVAAPRSLLPANRLQSGGITRRQRHLARVGSLH